jgi:hypothetical protein
VNAFQLTDEIRRNCGLVQNDAGAWLCTCGVVLEGQALICEACRRQQALDAQRAAREQAVASWRAKIERYGSLPCLPTFPGKVHGRKLQATVQRYQLDRSLVLMGPTGCGKTSAVMATLRRIAADEVPRVLASKPGTEPSALLERLRGLAWIDGFALAKARRETPLGRGEAELVALAFEAPILVLDEVGFEPLNEVVFEVADRRYREGAITIVTSGQTPAGFAARYGDACWRRLSEQAAVISEWPESKQEAG